MIGVYFGRESNVQSTWPESFGSAGKFLESVVAALAPSPRRKPGSRTLKWNAAPKILDSGFRRNDVESCRISGLRLNQDIAPYGGQQQSHVLCTRIFTADI